MRRGSRMLIGLGACAALLGMLAPVANAAPTRGATATATAATSATVRHFTATGTLGRYYSTQTVTGTYKNIAGRPVNVTVYDWQGTALLTKPYPVLDPTWWGNYWKTTYGLDQWRIGTVGGNGYHLMLPAAPMGSTFQALLVTEFGPNGANGNWQNWLTGTSS